MLSVQFGAVHSPLPKTLFIFIVFVRMLWNNAATQCKKVLVKLFQKLARSSRVGLSPSADGETPKTAFSFANFSFAPTASKEKWVMTFYVATRLLSLKAVGTGASMQQVADCPRL